MRFEGVVKTWSDDRGFGFIEPMQGGQEIFVHARAFPRSAGRPMAGQKVTFEIGLDRDRRKRAENVQLLRVSRPMRRRVESPARWSAVSLLAIPAFVLLYAVVSIMWRVPVWLAAVYVGASVASILVYAIDKSAAVAGRWRVSEGTLLLIGLVGGWPGSLVAQQVLRHKVSKASFRSAFWMTVVLNVVGFVVAHSPFFLAFRR